MPDVEVVTGPHVGASKGLRGVEESLALGFRGFREPNELQSRRRFCPLQFPASHPGPGVLFRTVCSERNPPNCQPGNEDRPCAVSLFCCYSRIHDPAAIGAECHRPCRTLPAIEYYMNTISYRQTKIRLIRDSRFEIRDSIFSITNIEFRTSNLEFDECRQHSHRFQDGGEMRWESSFESLRHDVRGFRQKDSPGMQQEMRWIE